jgi:hypothetical protein
MPSSGSLTGNGVNIQFNAEFPTALNFSKSAEWCPVSPMGRFSPVFGYSSSGAATVTFSLRFSIEEGDVMSRVRQVRSLVYPVPGGYRPTKVLLIIENWVRIEGVVSTVSDVVPDDAAWIEAEPSVVDVSITVQECSLYRQYP